MAEKFDILIIGGGLVGASLLCALESTITEKALKVGLIEAHDLNESRDRPPNYDARASALSYGTRRIYEQLGLWTEFEPYATPILDIHVSDKGHFGSTHLSHTEENVPALGYVIENHRLGEVLLQHMKRFREEGLVEIISPAEVVSLKPVPDAQAQLLVRSKDEGLDKDTRLVCNLAILADGGRSSLIDKLGIYRKEFNYEQHALIANVTLDQAHNGVAYERFAGKGPMALLPLSLDKEPLDKEPLDEKSLEEPSQSLSGHRSALIWTVPSDDIDQVMALDDETFLSILQDKFGTRAGMFIKVGTRDTYPLSLSIAQEQVRPGLVLLGNAAHTMHPVAGQGYNLAIRDVVALAENITSSLNRGIAPGQLSRLLEYVKKQKDDQKMTLGFCDNLVKLFARKEQPAILMRNLGLTALDLNRTLKSKFARKAMGL